MASRFWNSVVASLLLAPSGAPAMAQKPNPLQLPRSKPGPVQIGAGGSLGTMQDQINEIERQLKEGEKALKEANEKATETRQAWQTLDTEHKQRQRDLAQAKKSAEDEAKNSPEVKAAQEKLEGLRRELAEIRKEVIETLTSENEAYQKTCKVHEEAIALQKSNSGIGASSETRKEFAKKVAEADKNKKTIEDAAMADNVEAKELVKQIKEATAELGAATKKKAEAIETDPKLSSAKIASQRTRDDLKKAKVDLDQAEGEANRIRSAMQTLANQRASIQSRMDLQQRSQTGGQGGNNANKKGGN